MIMERVIALKEHLKNIERGVSFYFKTKDLMRSLCIILDFIFKNVIFLFARKKLIQSAPLFRE